jgi:hypothetical protein
VGYTPPIPNKEPQFEIAGLAKLISMLTVLSLVKEKPKTYLQFWWSGRFRNQKILRKAIFSLERAGCLKKIWVIQAWRITNTGVTFLAYSKTVNN